MVSSNKNTIREEPNESRVLQLEKITKKFPLYPAANNVKKEYFFALKDISLSVSHNDFVVLGGANGSGKSLLMTIIAGLVKPTSGKITRKASVGLVFQNPDIQIIGETPWEDVLVGPRNQGARGKILTQIGQQVLEQVGLAEKARFPSRSLSGGEKRRLATAGILAMKRNLIIFDEPYANLDYIGVQQTNALLTQLHQEGKTIILLTHEIEKCLALANRFMVLYRGDLVFDGTSQEGLHQNLESWAIRHPLRQYCTLEDLVWR